MVITFRDFLMFYKIFLLQQMKQSVTVNNKHGIYELPNDLRFKILGNCKISEKI